MDEIIQLANKAMNMLDATELNNKDKILITDAIHKIRSKALTLTDVGCSTDITISKKEYDILLRDSENLQKVSYH
jgi:hypothetical protein